MRNAVFKTARKSASARRSHMADRRADGRPACRHALLALACLLAACSTKPVPPPAAVPKPIVPSPAAVQRSPSEQFQSALDQLQNGNAQMADKELHAYLKSVPGSKPAQFLISQIETPLNDLFPKDSFAITLAENQSLSSLAQTYLGDPLGFYGLARYNKIPVPAKVNAGRIIHIPKTPTAIAAMNARRSAEPAPGPAQAQSAEKPALSPSEVWDRIAKAVRQHRYDDAVETADDAHFVPDRTQAGPLAGAYIALAHKKRHSDPDTASVYAFKSGQLFLTAEEPEKALASLRLATMLAPDAPEPKALLAQTSRKIAARYYHAGLLAFQHQNLDLAIEDWTKVIAIDPTYKNAQLNRAQALHLKENLRKLRE